MTFSFFFRFQPISAAQRNEETSGNSFATATGNVGDDESDDSDDSDDKVDAILDRARNLGMPSKM